MNAATFKIQGMWQIIRFNPWFYVAAFGLIGLGGWLQPWAWPGLPQWMQSGIHLGFWLGCWWAIASLLVSHWIYDRSDWPEGGWLQTALGGGEPQRVLNVHAGFDETSERLRRWLPGTEVISLSLFDPLRLTERSIHRAASYRPSATDELVGSPEHWPLPKSSFDLVCFLLSAHEYRTGQERSDLLLRAKEALNQRVESRVVIAEHVRDLANFIAFGPGFTHFHSVARWTEAWTAAGLVLETSQRVTPFLRVWTLRPVASSDD